MNPKKIYQVDAFTETPFKGNPAGVMFVNETTTAEWMQNMAAEMNLSETAFIIAASKSFGIRYFTPVNEVPLCGHATLAAAHIIYELGIVARKDQIVFNAKETDLIIKAENDMLIMDFPKYQLTKTTVPDDFEAIVGFIPTEIYSTNDNWTLAVAKEDTPLLNAVPDFDKMKTAGIDPLIITAESSTKDYDFLVRCFAPSFGINEDPVTGSAHCALTPLWFSKLQKNNMTSFQASKRGGLLNVSIAGERVKITGKAVTIFEATLMI